MKTTEKCAVYVFIAALIISNCYFVDSAACKGCTVQPCICTGEKGPP
ncbi:hypothetical protein AVEN_164128-1, partial [Araneus ventricosus]